MQEGEGHWNAAALPNIAKFFMYGLPSQIAAVNQATGDRNAVWVTLLALYILSEKYDEESGEWVMLASKAKQ